MNLLELSELRARIRAHVPNALSGGKLLACEHIEDYGTGEHRFIVLWERELGDGRMEYGHHVCQINEDQTVLIWGHYFTEGMVSESESALDRAWSSYLDRVREYKIAVPA